MSMLPAIARLNDTVYFILNEVYNRPENQKQLGIAMPEKEVNRLIRLIARGYDKSNFGKGTDAIIYLNELDTPDAKKAIELIRMVYNSNSDFDKILNNLPSIARLDIAVFYVVHMTTFEFDIVNDFPLEELKKIVSLTRATSRLESRPSGADVVISLEKDGSQTSKDAIQFIKTIFLIFKKTDKFLKYATEFSPPSPSEDEDADWGDKDDNWGDED